MLDLPDFSHSAASQPKVAADDGGTQIIVGGETQIRVFDANDPARVSVVAQGFPTLRLWAYLGRVVPSDPILARRHENIGHAGVFQRFGRVGQVGRDGEALAPRTTISRPPIMNRSAPLSIIENCSFSWRCSGTAASFFSTKRATVSRSVCTIWRDISGVNCSTGTALQSTWFTTAHATMCFSQTVRTL